MRQIGLQSIGKFTNSYELDETNIIQCQPRLFLSPSGNFVAKLDQLCNPKIFHTSTYEAVNQNISFKFVSMVFHANDRQLFYMTPLKLVKYDLKSMQEKLLISSKNNSAKMSLLSFSQDYRSLFYLNFSDVYTGDLREPEFSPALAVKSTQNCNISYYKLHPSLPSLITSSQRCYLCKWEMVNGAFTVTKELNISKINPSCQTYQIVFKENDVFLAQKYNTQSKVQIFKINFQTFTNQSILRTFQNIGQWSYLVLVQNYFLTYLGRANTAWINKDVLSNSSQVYILPYQSYIRHAIYNPYKLELYHYLQQIKQDGTYNIIDRLQINFNCALLNASNTASNKNQKVVLSANCHCPAPQVYNRSSMQCQTKSCGYSNGPACSCPSNHRFDSFKQQCILDCLTYQHGLLTLPFGTPSQCHCEYPYDWSDIDNGCKLNCSNIKNALTSGFGQNCQCRQGFRWLTIQNKCVQIIVLPDALIKPLPIPQATELFPIIEPIPSQIDPNPQPKPNPPLGPSPASVQVKESQSHNGLTYFFIMLSVVLLIIYWFIYKRITRKRNTVQREAQDKPEKDIAPKVDQVNTSRPLPPLPISEDVKYPVLKSSEILSNPQLQPTNDYPVEMDQNLQSFSIDGEEEDQHNNQAQKEFSQIQSNIQNPLK